MWLTIHGSNRARKDATELFAHVCFLDRHCLLSVLKARFGLTESMALEAVSIPTYPGVKVTHTVLSGALPALRTSWCH
jgi:hypothetical protein